MSRARHPRLSPRPEPERPRRASVGRPGRRAQGRAVGLAPLVTVERADLPPLAIERVRVTYGRLLSAGLSVAEAGNLTARLAGLHATGRPWTVEEVERLLFIGSLVDAGRIRS